MTTQTPYHGYVFDDNPNSGYWYRRACDNSHQLVALVGQKRALNQMLRVMKDGDTWETTACRLAGLVIQAKQEQTPECEHPLDMRDKLIIGVDHFETVDADHEVTLCGKCGATL